MKVSILGWIAGIALLVITIGALTTGSAMDKCLKKHSTETCQHELGL